MRRGVTVWLRCAVGSPRNICPAISCILTVCGLHPPERSVLMSTWVPFGAAIFLTVAALALVRQMLFVRGSRGRVPSVDEVRDGAASVSDEDQRGLEGLRSEER